MPSQKSGSADPQAEPALGKCMRPKVSLASNFAQMLVSRPELVHGPWSPQE